MGVERNILRSDFFVREKIDKPINYIGIWWLRLVITKKIYKELSKKYSLERNTFQYELETTNFGQYYRIKNKKILIWFGYDYSSIVNMTIKSPNNFFIAYYSSKNINQDFIEIQRFRRTGYKKTNENWYYKKINKINTKVILDEINNLLENKGI